MFEMSLVWIGIFLMTIRMNLSGRMNLPRWSGFALLLLAAVPAQASDGKTFWVCDDVRGCVQIEQPASAPLMTPAVKPLKVPRAVHVVPVVAPVKKPIPLETLIEMSLVTGVFQ